MDGEDGFDYLFKIVLIGDMGVGKSCIVQRFKNGSFVERQGTTIGVDFTMKTLMIEGKRVKLQSFESLQRWIDDVSKFAAPNVIKLLVGTKCDLEAERVLEYEEGEHLARSQKMLSYVETSAKTSHNVDSAFLELATSLKRQHDVGAHLDAHAPSEGFRLGVGGTSVVGRSWQDCCRFT